MSREKMGTLRWGDASNGKLSRGNTLALVRNLAFVQAREVADAVRQRFGLLSVSDLSLDAMHAPTTPLAQDALEHAQETHSQALLFHSWRTYYLGRFIAEQRGIEYNNEVFFAAAILHDLGLTRDNATPLSACCFAVQGARQAKSFLDLCGHGGTANDKISEAIALHLNIHVSSRVHGAEAFMLARGATCDLFGFGRRRVKKTNLIDLFDRFPREGVMDALQFETADHLEGSRADFLTGLSGGKAPKTPFFDTLKPKGSM
ncbi:HD domain-containing protein [uncultured Litoreibacter sp.]|uniref:HD domain-containing protein n=1 Tax=uncultured Litoreibacter sp. TaxID=1392394 RepID=UPI002628698E|nr:HD domain-containing protein [uncultured Litoreibacter sp.]